MTPEEKSLLNFEEVEIDNVHYWEYMVLHCSLAWISPCTSDQDEELRVVQQQQIEGD